LVREYCAVADARDWVMLKVPPADAQAFRALLMHAIILSMNARLIGFALPRDLGSRTSQRKAADATIRMRAHIRNT
jgi:hypothetical protein